MSTRPESPTRHSRARMMVAVIVLLVLAVSAALMVRAEREHAGRVQAAIATLSPLQEEPRTTLQLLADDEQSLRRFDAWLLGANILLVFSALIGLARTGRPVATTSDSSVVLGLTGVEGLPPASTQQGSVATPQYFTRVVELARRYGFVLFSDECYSEIYTQAAPTSALQVEIGRAHV